VVIVLLSCWKRQYHHRMASQIAQPQRRRIVIITTTEFLFILARTSWPRKLLEAQMLAQRQQERRQGQPQTRKFGDILRCQRKETWRIPLVEEEEEAAVKIPPPPTATHRIPATKNQEHPRFIGRLLRGSHSISPKMTEILVLLVVVVILIAMPPLSLLLLYR